MALGLSQDAVGEAIGMSQQGVDNIEHGKVARPRLLAELAEALGTTREWLLWGEGPEEIAITKPMEQILQLVQGIDERQAALVIRFLKTLSEAAA